MEDKDRASIKVTKAESSSPKPVSKTPFVVAPKAVVMPKVVLGLKMASAAVKKEKPVAMYVVLDSLPMLLVCAERTKVMR